LVLFLRNISNFLLEENPAQFCSSDTFFFRHNYFISYIEPWHADVFDFLDLRKNTGKEEQRARDLFLGLWIPDLFMKRTFLFG